MSVIATLGAIAAVIIALEIFIILLIPGIILFLAVKGMGWTHRQVRRHAPPVRALFRQAATTAEDISQKVAAPVFVASTAAARIRRMQATLASHLFPREV